MKKSVLSALLATAVVCVIFVTSSCSTQVKDNEASKDAAGAEETTPVGAVIDSGNISNNTGLNAAYNLDMGRGKYVNLYIENKGPNDVVATINGNSSKTFKPGDQGNIYAEVTQGLWGGDTEYVFKVVTGRDGGIVNINYEITQGAHAPSGAAA